MNSDLQERLSKEIGEQGQCIEQVYTHFKDIEEKIDNIGKKLGEKFIGGWLPSTHKSLTTNYQYQNK
jgi:hypothetical protein